MIIFSLDALADDSHRRHFITQPWPPKCTCEFYGPSNCMQQEYIDKYGYEGELWKPNWESYNAACEGDEPITSVRQIFNSLVLNDYCRTNGKLMGHIEIQLWSERCVSNIEKTTKWIDKHLYYNFCDFDFDMTLKMRPIGDDSPQEELFEKWVDQFADARKEIEMVFSSHKPTIDMLRRRGVFVFDCGQEV